jgi:hypothetical protein
MIFPDLELLTRVNELYCDKAEPIGEVTQLIPHDIPQREQPFLIVRDRAS